MNEQNTPITPERIRDELGQHIIDCMCNGDEANEICALITTYLLVHEACNRQSPEPPRLPISGIPYHRK